MTVDEIRELIKLATETGIAELEVQRGDNRVRIRRTMGSAQEFVWAPQAAPGRVETPMAGSPPIAPEKPPETGPDPKLSVVRSPIVGTFYEGSGPGEPAFVQVGDAVQPGKVLCIIESMKLMNEIEAEIAGTIESRLVTNGQPVEYGEGLFAIRPN
jgi:acetyl-CoA carboxylase biotin carboxyl carrier protein